PKAPHHRHLKFTQYALENDNGESKQTLHETCTKRMPQSGIRPKPSTHPSAQKHKHQRKKSAERLETGTTRIIMKADKAIRGSIKHHKPTIDGASLELRAKDLRLEVVASLTKLCHVMKATGTCHTSGYINFLYVILDPISYCYINTLSNKTCKFTWCQLALNRQESIGHPDQICHNDRTVKQKCRYVLLWSNHLLNRFYLRNLKQNNRPLDEFLTEANLLTQNSGYPDEIHDKLMRDALVFGVDSDTVRKKCIAEGNELTLIKAREIARTEEATRQQLKVMTSDISNPIQVDSLQKNRRGNMNRGKTKPLYDRQKGYKMKWDKPVCTRCGNTTHNKDQKCPAIKAQCFGCKKTGHYQNMCFKAIKTNCNSLERDDSNSNEPDIDEKIFLGTLLAEQCPNIGANPNQINSLSTEQRKKVLIETHLTAEPYHKYTTPVVCKIDTGAELNVLSKHDYETIVPNPKRRWLVKNHRLWRS
ncbi:Hypothetical predicted protein, partial [Paramuricea clavata]